MKPIQNNFNDKIVLTLRILFGLMMVFSSLAYFFNLFPSPELSGNFKTFSDGLEASGYLMPLVKVIELLCGIGFITNRFLALAALMIFPIVVNILAVHIFLVPEGLPLAIALFLVNVLVIYAKRKQYSGLIKFK